MPSSKNRKNTYSLGIDFGTNSVRALVVDTRDGREIATHVSKYPSGESGVLLDSKDPNLARQNPGDYIKGLAKSVKAAVLKAKEEGEFSVERLVGIGVDTTGSTPLPVDQEGMPLAFRKEFRENLSAQAWLWKDHTAHAEAAEITDKAQKSRTKYLSKCGGTYSSEWYWSKILHCRSTAPKVFAAAYSWVELADFIPAYLTGNTKPENLSRGICAAGHKAMYHEDWGGLPSETFLSSLNPELARLRNTFASRALPSDQVAGYLTAEVARTLGLREGIPVAVGAFDAHHGAVGSGIKPGTLVKIMGTSTCDCMVAQADAELKDIPGVCGIVPGSIIPGMVGIEAGQSAVGDIFNWFVSHLAPERYGRGDRAHEKLTQEAEQIRPGASGLVALDWNNGNRTVLVDPRLTGMLMGQTLSTSAPEIYRALIEATAFGALMIINRIEDFGVPVKEVVTCGGISDKSSLVLQIYADVCRRPIKVSASTQTCALGASIFGAVVGGAHKSVASAQKRMTHLRPTVFKPRRESAEIYARLFEIYKRLHDGFGGLGKPQSMHRVMKDLLSIRDSVRGN